MVKTTFQQRPGHHVGDVVSRFESGSSGSAIGKTPGDIGGPSYGKFQIARDTGTLKAFLDWSKYSGYPPLGTPSFDSWWKLRARDPKFQGLQYDFLISTHYLTALADYPTLGDHPATAEAVFAAANGHGPAGARKLLKRALTNAEPLDPRSVVVRIYSERRRTDINGIPAYYKSSSPPVQRSVMRRLAEERDVILRELLP